jgi:hypothetical protein
VPRLVDLHSILNIYECRDAFGCDCGADSWIGSHVARHPIRSDASKRLA